MKNKLLVLSVFLVMLTAVVSCSGYLDTTNNVSSDGGGSGPTLFFLTTTNAGNSQRGILFNITAKRNLTVKQFSVIPDTTNAGVNVEVWYKIGGISTNTNGLVITNNWIFTGSNVVNFTTFDLTLVPVQIDVPIDSGNTVAFLVIRTDGYTISYQTSLGTDFSNDDLIVGANGCGVSFPFGTGSYFYPRSFCGGIYYQ